MRGRWAHDGGGAGSRSIRPRRRDLGRARQPSKVPITDQTDLTAQVRALPGGEKADVTFTRDGESQTVTVTLGTFEG